MKTFLLSICQKVNISNLRHKLFPLFQKFHWFIKIDFPFVWLHALKLVQTLFKAVIFSGKLLNASKPI